MKLTKREQVLVTVLVTVVILVGGFMLLILPQNEEKEVLKNEVNDLAVEMTEMKTAIMQKSKIEEQLKASGDSIDGSLDKISGPLHNETFDSLVNRLANKYTITVNTLSYSLPKVMKPDVQYGVPLELEYALKDEVNKLNQTEEETESDKVSEYDIIHKTITIEVEGTSHQIKNFVDGLYTGGHTTIYVNNLNIDMLAGNASITQDLFSIDKIKIQ